LFDGEKSAAINRQEKNRFKGFLNLQKGIEFCNDCLIDFSESLAAES
jgi:hypothetical protein